MKELVSVIVPISNPNLSATEERLLHHCLEMMGNYPIIFISYPNADLGIIREHQEEIDVIYFPKEYFESRQSLARLFLMEDFYDQFTFASYLLVHELNSWIFKDELHYWCKQGYDYLKAAPVADKNSKLSFFSGLLSNISGPDDAEKQRLGDRFQDNGLYLCLVERMIKTLKSKNKEAYKYRHQSEIANYDSVFWEAEANRLWPNLRKPTGIVQSYFSQHIDNEINIADKPKDKLPFALTGINSTNINALLFAD